MEQFESLLAGLDLKLFEKIHSQTSQNDKRSLLAVQQATREIVPAFTYLEIGSYQGGSLQPYVLDDCCSKVFSIDLRPTVSADDRGHTQIYQNNTTAQMIANLE